MGYRIDDGFAGGSRDGLQDRGEKARREAGAEARQPPGLAVDAAFEAEQKLGECSCELNP